MNQLVPKVYLLLGGGIDSTALIFYYLSRKIPLQGIHVDYGQPSLLGERRSVSSLAKYYDIPLKTLKLGASITDVQGEYLCRNALLLLLTASTLHIKQGILSLGIHTGTAYYDCSSSFLQSFQKLLDGYFAGSVQVEAPFIELTKKDIFEYCKLHKIPIEMTFSCERKGDSPCGICLSCIDRRMLNEGF
ncbi:putative PP-loop superfamily ATPase [Leptolyngbya sp. PCC 7375]|nr:putative PP-loop superfamily ATPase [Leptolyngbya sp. PCC 7375]